MIRLQIKHIDGTTNMQLEVWRSEKEDTSDALVCIVPLDSGEVVVAASDNILCQAGENGECVAVLQ